MPFFDTSVLFWGHVLLAGGVLANPQKVEKVWDWPTPTNVKEVHSFLESASYYGGLFPNFPWIAHCLHKLVGPMSNKTKNLRGQKKEGKTVAGQKFTKEKNFNWMPEHQQALEMLKEGLVTAPVLG